MCLMGLKLTGQGQRMGNVQTVKSAALRGDDSKVMITIAGRWAVGGGLPVSW